MIELLGSILMLVAAASAPGEAPERFAAAQRQFEAAQAVQAAEGEASIEARRMFRLAAGAFADLAQEGIRSANLRINAGNAYYFAGDAPRAMLWYLRAERLARTPEVRVGLATLRRVCGAELWPPPKPTIGRVLMFWHYDLSSGLKQVLLLTLYPAGTALAGASLFARRRRLYLRTGLALMLLGGVAGVSDMMASTAAAGDWAVVLQPAKGLAGDGPMYSTLVEAIPPGQEVRLLEQRTEYHRIELPGGTRCWVTAEHVEAVSLTRREAAGS